MDMRKSFNSPRRWCTQRLLKTAARHRPGAIVPLVAVMLVALLMLSALAINTAYVELARTEMHIAADAAARAGGRELTIARSLSAASKKAKRLGRLNTVGGKPLTLSGRDIQFGVANRPSANSRYRFKPTRANPTSVKVIARRTSRSKDGPLGLVLPKLLGLDQIETEQSSISTQVQVDIVLVIDRSGSMAYAANETAAFPPAPRNAPSGWYFCDPAPPLSRWRDLTAAVDVFLSQLTSSPAPERVALVTYADAASADVAVLTENYFQIKRGLDQYTRSLCAGRTNIGDGIQLAANTAISAPGARNGASKVIVVLTDGIHNAGKDPVEAAQQASRDGAVIFSVTFSGEADQGRMQQVASDGKGLHFHATNGDDLKQVFREIAASLPTLLTE